MFASMCLAFLLTPSPRAHADLINGVCALDLTFTFTSAPTVTGPSPGYTISTDVDKSECTLDTLDPTPFVSASGSADAGSGGTSLSRCGVLGGIGPWNQSFGGVVPSVIAGSHAVAGTWLHATMYTTAFPNDSPLKFNSVIELTPHPYSALGNAAQINACRVGGSVTSIRMLGVQVFNDPAV